MNKRGSVYVCARVCVFQVKCLCIHMTMKSVTVKSVHLLYEYISKGMHVCIFEKLGERCIFTCVCQCTN